jgi:conjugal transfer ATP-binding protein TraC
MKINAQERQETLIRTFGVLHAYSEEDGIFVLSPDRLGFGVIADPLSGFDEQTMDSLNALLNLHYPNNTLVQFSLYKSPDIEETLHQYKVMRHGQENALLKQMCEARVDFMRELTQRPIGQVAGAKLGQVQLIITVQIKHGVKEPTREDMLELRELRNTFTSTLKNIGFRFQDLTPDKYIRVMEAILNHGPDAVWRRSPWSEYDENQLICNQLLDAETAIEYDKKQISLGDHAKVRVLSVKRYPDFVYPGMAMRYLANLMTGQKAMRDPLLVTVNIIYPDHETVRGRIEKDHAWTTRNVDGPMAKYIPAWARRHRSLSIAQEAIEDGDRMVKAYIGLAVFSENEDRVVQASTEAQAMMRELGFQLMEDRFAVLPLFSQLLPFCNEEDTAAAINRYRRLPTRHVVPLLPVLGSWRGTGTPLLTLFARDGNLMRVSPNDTDGNMNVVVAAQSGAGKSFLSNEVIFNFLSVGGRAWIIDKGFSYKPLASYIDGTYIEFSNDIPLCVNPFPLVKNWEDEADIIASLVEIMAAPKEGLSDYQTAGLKRVLTEIWETYGPEADIDKLAPALLADKSDDKGRLRDIGSQLWPFTSEGEYGRFFNGPNTCDLNNQLVILELQQLAGREHLQRVVLLQIMYQIQQAMDSLPVQMPKVLLIDEAFALLNSNETSKFIVAWYRQLRKFGATAMICTQSINDFYDSTGSKAILENSAHMWLLSQKSDSLAILKKENRLPISESAMRLLETVHTQPGEYSEIFVRNAWGIGIGRLVVSDFNKLLYSTSAKDKAAKKSYLDRGYSLPDAINAILAERKSA